MTATADIVTDVRDDALGVPIQAVAVRTPEQLGHGGKENDRRWEPDTDGFVEIVFVVGHGKAQARQVHTGIQSETHIEIVEGLSNGEEIVIGNYRAISRDLQDGSMVVRANEASEGPPGSG